jgi:hypothetical protein
VQDARDIDHITAHDVHHDVRQRGQHELARSFFRPESATVWKCSAAGASWIARASSAARSGACSKR